MTELGGGPFSSVGNALTPALEAPGGESPLYPVRLKSPTEVFYGGLFLCLCAVVGSGGLAGGQCHWTWLAFCGPSSLVEGLGRGPFPGRRYPGGHLSLSPAGEESKCVVGTAVVVGALWPKIGPCLHGAQHRPSLTAVFPPHSARLCPPLPAGTGPASAASLCHSLCLLLERSDLSRTWKGPRGPRAGWGSRGGHVRGCCMGFFFSLSLSADALA